MNIFKKSLKQGKQVFFTVILHLVVKMFKFFGKNNFLPKKNLFGLFLKKKIKFLGFFDPWTIFVKFTRKIIYCGWFWFKTRKYKIYFKNLKFLVRNMFFCKFFNFLNFLTFFGRFWLIFAIFLKKKCFFFDFFKINKT